MQIDNPYSQCLPPTSSSSSSHPQYATPSAPVSGRGWRSLGRFEPPPPPLPPTTTLGPITTVRERRGPIRGRGEMERFGRMDLPGRPVEYILFHLYGSYQQLDPVFHNGYNYEHCARRGLYNEDVLNGRTFWSTLTFAKKLEAFAGLSPCWDLAVRALPFWDGEYADWICTDRCYEVPHDNPVLHLSWIPQQGIPRCCTVCLYLFHTFKILPVPFTASTKYHTLKTTDLGELIVCSRHSALNVCGKCLMIEDVEHDPNTGVVQMRDPKIWGDALCICRGCRAVAVEIAVEEHGYNQRHPKTNLKCFANKHLRQLDVKQYIFDGWGTIRDVLAALDRERWIMDRSGIQGNFRAWLDDLKTLQLRSACAKISAAVRNGTYSLEKGNQKLAQEEKKLQDYGPTYSNEEYCGMQNNFLQYLVNDAIMSGYWVTVADQANRPYEPLWKSQCCVDDTEFGDVLFNNELYYNHCDVPHLNDMPATMYSEMTQLFVTELDQAITPFLQCVKNIFLKLAKPHYEVARAKAQSMGAEELLDWIRDPRTVIADWSRMVKPFEYPPVISDTEQKAAEAASNAMTTKRKRQRASDEVNVEIAGEHGQVLGGSRPVLGVGGVGRDSRAFVESGAVVSEDAQTSPFFNSKRRATSVAPRLSTSPASDGNAEDVAGTRRSSADSMADSHSSDSMQATTTVVSPYVPAGIPPTPSLTADYTEASTPTHSRISCSDEPPSPTLRPVILPLNDPPRSYIAAMVNAIPWPKPSPVLSPEDFRVYEMSTCGWRCGSPWLPITGSSVSAVVYSVIAERWAKLWEDHDVCQCGVCRREATTRVSSIEGDLMRHVLDLGNTLKEWVAEDDELEATGDEATDHSSEEYDADERDENFDEEENQQDFREER